MIITGKSRGTPQKLGRYLDSAGKNERVRQLEIRGTVAEDVLGAILEMAAHAEGTRCEKPLYHAMINPEPPHRLSPDQRTEAVDALEEKLGLTGHARVVVLHEKLGREHLHVVWSRIDLEHMRAVSDSHNYRKHEEVARDLERRFGHDRVQGAHHEREGVERPERTPSREEYQQQERTGITAKQVKVEVTAAFRTSDGPEPLRVALAERGYVLASGDRRDFVIVDRLGGVHSLARRIEGMKAAELRAFMKPLDVAGLPTVEQAKEMQQDLAHGVTPAWDMEKWERALGDSAIKKAKELEEEQARRREELRESRDEAMIELAYGRGEDYVSQTRAALKDHQARQEALDAVGKERPKRPHIEIDPDALREKEILDQYDRERRQTKEEIASRSESPGTASGDDPNTRNSKRMRLDRLLNAIEAHDEKNRDRKNKDDPDRQREAPGGGRTRSR